MDYSFLLHFLGFHVSMDCWVRLLLNIQLKRYVLSTPTSRSLVDLPENIEAKLFIHPLLYSWNINSAIYSFKSFTITAYF